MGHKIAQLLGSIRFWQISLVAILALLDGQALIPVVQVWLSAVAALGTFDAVATRIGGKK